jgi:hypothetical protein
MTAGLEPGGTPAPDVRTITITLPTGQKWPMPAWMAAGIIEGLLRDDRAVYSRHMMNVTTGESRDKPGRKSDG